MRSGKPPHGRISRQQGFGYLMVLFALVALGILLAGVGTVWHTAVRRDKEAELLHIGHQFRRALTSYYLSTPGDAKQFPLALSDLLEDRRFPTPKRHLRRLYADPVAATSDWELVVNGGRIVGVQSSSDAPPLRSHFTGADESFSGAESYRQWVFGFDEAAVAVAPLSGKVP